MLFVASCLFAVLQASNLEALQEKAEAAIVSEREAQAQSEMKSQELCATLERYKVRQATVLFCNS